MKAETVLTFAGIGALALLAFRRMAPDESAIIAPLEIPAEVVSPTGPIQTVPGLMTYLSSNLVYLGENSAAGRIWAYYLDASHRFVFGERTNLIQSERSCNNPGGWCVDSMQMGPTGLPDWIWGMI